MTNGDFSPIFTKNKLLNHMDNKSISWFFGSKSHETTFRTSYEVPRITRKHDGFAAQLNRRY